MKNSDQNLPKDKRKLEKDNLEKVSGGRLGPPFRPRGTPGDTGRPKRPRE